MKTTVTIPKAEEKETFPALYERSYDNVIIFITGKNGDNLEGFAINSTEIIKAGAYSSQFKAHQFTRLPSGAKITLEQE